MTTHDDSIFQNPSSMMACQPRAMAVTWQAHILWIGWRQSLDNWIGSEFANSNLSSQHIWKKKTVFDRSIDVKSHVFKCVQGNHVTCETKPLPLSLDPAWQDQHGNKLSMIEYSVVPQAASDPHYISVSHIYIIFDSRYINIRASPDSSPISFDYFRSLQGIESLSFHFSGFAMFGPISIST